MRLPVSMSRSRRLIAATSVAIATSLAVPAVALAAPAATPAPQAPQTPPATQTPDQRTLDSLGAFAPAIIGAVTTPGPDGRINADLINQAQSMAENPALPTQVKDIWRQITDFLGAPGRERLAAQQVAEGRASQTRTAKPGDPVIPRGPGAPRIQEFLYPTLGFGCMTGTVSATGGNSLGRALVTAGPQAAPAPGPQRGQAGYVYTSLGTGPAVNNPARPLWVSWLNIDNGRTGQTPLKRNAQINAANGPGTFTGIANTGKGRIISTIYGDVTTKTKGRVISCTIAPTIGIAII